MASFTKRGDSWRVQVSHSGQRETRTFPSKREATEWARGRETELAAASSGSVIRKTLRHALERYKQDMAPTKRGGRWDVVRIDYVLRTWDACDRPMGEIKTGDLALWRDARLKEVKGASVLRDIALLRSVWRVARQEWRYCDSDPWESLTKPADSRARTRIFNDTEIDRIVDALGYKEGSKPESKRQEVALIFLLSLETAMRSGEMVSLEWADVDLATQTIHLDMTKNGDSRDVPLSRKAVGLLELMKGPEPSGRVFTLTDGLRDTYFRQARDIAEVHGATFHDGRATALTRLAKRLSVLELARMVGHRDPRSLMVYYRESATNIAKLLD
jgi:integrase